MNRLIFLYAILELAISPAYAQTNVTTSGSFSLTGQYAQPHCQLTESSTITLNLANCASGGTWSFWIPVSATDTLAFPTGFLSGQAFEIKVSHAASGNPGALTFAAGWRMPAASLNASGQPTWSTTNGVDDKIACEMEPSTAADAQGNYIASCSNIVLNIKPVATTPPPPPPPPQLAAGTYWFGLTQNSNTVAIDINNGMPQAFVPANSTYMAEQFVWNGSGQLQKHDCSNPYFAASGKSMTCKTTLTDTFQILPSGSGYTIKDLTHSVYLNLISTCTSGFSACVGFSTKTPATVWTAVTK